MRHNPAAGAVVIMLRTLKMHGMAQAVGELTEQGSPAFEAALPILSQLLKAETADREVRSTAYQLKAARFPNYRDLAGFDFASSEVNEALTRQLQKPYEDNDASWGRVISLTTAYAAVIDVQPYVPTAFASFNPKGLLQYARETALYDLMFRLPQLRPSDAVRLCKGLLGFRDENELTPDGWSLGHSLEIIGALFDRNRTSAGRS